MSEIRSHSPPAPMPSTTRPPESADSDVTVRASMGAGRVGRLVTLAKPAMLPGAPEDEPERRRTRPGGADVGMVRQREEVEPVPVGLLGHAAAAPAASSMPLWCAEPEDDLSVQT